VCREQYKMLQKCKIRAIYRPICKKLRKILFPQVCLHRIIQGINPRLILKYCFLCVTKYNEGKNMVLKVKHTNHSSNLTMRSREVQLPATHQDDPGCLTHVWPMFDSYYYIRSNPPPPPTSTTLYILARNINILFLQNIFYRCCDSLSQNGKNY
jgi:hypothetical protein